MARRRLLARMLEHPPEGGSQSRGCPDAESLEHPSANVTELGVGVLEWSYPGLVDGLGLSAKSYQRPLAPSPWPEGCGNRAAISKGGGRVPGDGRGWQPSTPRQASGRGDGGAGEEGAISTGWAG